MVSSADLLAITATPATLKHYLENDPNPEIDAIAIFNHVASTKASAGDLSSLFDTAEGWTQYLETEGYAGVAALFEDFMSKREEQKKMKKALLVWFEKVETATQARDKENWPELLEDGVLGGDGAGRGASDGGASDEGASDKALSDRAEDGDEGDESDGCQDNEDPSDEEVGAVQTATEEASRR